VACTRSGTERIVTLSWICRPSPVGRRSRNGARSLTSTRVTLSQIASWISFVYSKKEARPGLRFHYSGALPVTLVTLLVPFRGETCPPVEASLIEERGDVVVVEVKGAWGRDFVFGGLKSAPVTVSGQRLQARAGILRTSPGREPQTILVAERD